MSEKGDWILVTGGTSGIGAQVVKRLAEKGLRPAIGYRSNREGAVALAEQFGGEAVPLDLLDFAQIDAAVAGLADQSLTGLVLNAGAAPSLDPFRSTPDQAFTDQINIAVIGNHRLLAGVIGNIFRSRKTGLVVGVMSKAMGTDSEPAVRNMTSYVVGKYGLLGLLRAAKAEYGWLKVETVWPTYTDTPMLGAFDERYVEILRQKNLIASPEDIAAEIVSKITETA